MTWDEQPTTQCPRCKTDLYWSYTPPPMPRYEEDFDETDWYCGQCIEAVHFLTLLKEWRAAGLEELREHRQWLRERAARRALKQAA